MTEELIRKVQAWLDSQGYPLEMKVARCFQNAGFHVSSSEYYIDPDEKKPREIDLIGVWGPFVQNHITRFKLIHDIR